MAGWDDEKLKRVVEQKKRGGDGERAKTDIVCKYFLDAIETKKRARKSRAARTAPHTRHWAWLSASDLTPGLAGPPSGCLHSAREARLLGSRARA